MYNISKLIDYKAMDQAAIDDFISKLGHESIPEIDKTLKDFVYDGQSYLDFAFTQNI
jgi:hypothetical protein